MAIDNITFSVEFEDVLHKYVYLDEYAFLLCVSQIDELNLDPVGIIWLGPSVDTWSAPPNNFPKLDSGYESKQIITKIDEMRKIALNHIDKNNKYTWLVEPDPGLAYLVHLIKKQNPTIELTCNYN